jgi:hypothetical protein
VNNDTLDLIINLEKEKIRLAINLWNEYFKKVEEPSEINNDDNEPLYFGFRSFGDD